MLEHAVLKYVLEQAYELFVNVFATLITVMICTSLSSSLCIMQVQLWKQHSKPTTGPLTAYSSHPGLSEGHGWTVQTFTSQRPAEQSRGSPSVEPASPVPMCLAFSGCGSFLAAGDGQHGGVRMWDVKTLQKVVVQSSREGKVSCITWDNTGRSSEQIFACGSTCGCVNMYGVSVHGIARLLHRQTAHRAAVVCLLFLNALSGNKLLSCDSDGHVVCTSWCASMHNLLLVLLFSVP